MAPEFGSQGSHSLTTRAAACTRSIRRSLVTHPLYRKDNLSMTIPHQHNEQPADTRPLTYDQAETIYPVRSSGGAERFSELNQRDLSARAAAILRERGEFDPENNLGHQVFAEQAPLTAEDRLKHMALGEVLACHYRHPAMLDRAAKARGEL